MKTIIKNGTIVTSNNLHKADIAVENGLITEISANIPTGSDFINAEGSFILPGGVDMHTQLALDSEAKFNAKAFTQNSIAALYGGVTTVVEEVISFNNNENALTYYQDQLKYASHVDYSFHQPIDKSFSSKELKNLEDNTLAGFPSCTVSTLGEERIVDEDIASILHRHSAFGGTAFIKCGSEASSKLLKNLLKLKNKTTPYALSSAYPSWGEEEGFIRMNNLAKAGNMAFCIDHIAAKEIVERLYKQEHEGLPISVSVSPLHLIFTDEKYQSHQENDPDCYKYLVYPPLRRKEDINALWKALHDGIIHFVTTCHNSVHLKHKLALAGKNVFNAPLNVPSIELRLPILFTEGVLKNKISLNKLADITATHVTRVAGLRNKGRIEVGTDADIVVFNPNVQKKVTYKNLHDACDYSPYEGIVLNGAVQDVLLRGNHVIKDYEFCAQETFGELIFRKAVAVR